MMDLQESVSSENSAFSEIALLNQAGIEIHAKPLIHASFSDRYLKIMSNW